MRLTTEIQYGCLTTHDLSQFLTSRTQNPEATVWAVLADKSHLIPARFDPKETTKFEQRQRKPLTSYKGAVMSLREITIRRERVPLREGGLSPDEFLVLHIGGIEQLGAAGEPLFKMKVVERGITKHIDSLKPIAEEPDMRKWLDGLKTGNGRVLQIEHMEGKQTSSKATRLQPSPSKDVWQKAPSNPVHNGSWVVKQLGDMTYDFGRNDTWVIPEDQLSLIGTYSNPAVTDEWFDDDPVEGLTDYEVTPKPSATAPVAMDVLTPKKQPVNIEACSPASVTLSGWGDSSELAESPPMTSPREEDEIDELEGEEEEETSNFSNKEEEIDVPCAQPPRVPASSTYFTTQFSSFSKDNKADSDEEEVLAEVSNGSLESRPTSPDPRPFGSLLGFTPSNFAFTDLNSGLAQTAGTQISSLTIKPTSSNEIPFSSKIPLGQRVKSTRSSLIPYSDSSQHDSEESRSEVASQLSQIGDDLYEDSELSALEDSDQNPVLSPIVFLSTQQPKEPPSKKQEPLRQTQAPPTTASSSDSFLLMDSVPKRDNTRSNRRTLPDMGTTKRSRYQSVRTPLLSDIDNLSMKSKASKRRRAEYEADTTPRAKQPKRHNPSEWFSPKSLERIKRDHQSGKNVSALHSPTKPKPPMLGSVAGGRRPRLSLKSLTVRERLDRDVPAAGGSLGALFGPQTSIGAEQMGTTPVYDLTNASPVTSDQWTASALLLTNINHDSSSAAALSHGYSEMDRLLDLLPSSVPEQSLDLGLGPLVSSNPDDWSWLNENAF
ncbi:hypothetical protein FRC17_000490 [Serendipita sp. 399]|nr:hypothetical protein FRC17_000490 [Serendipita sp. 399]